MGSLLGGIGSSLFGSDLFSGGGQQNSSSGTNYQQWQTDLAKRIRDIYEPKLGAGANVYQGDRVADLTGLQTGAIGAGNNFLSTFSNPASQGNPLMAETGQAIGGLLAGTTGAQKITPEQTQQYYEGYIKDPAIRTLKQDILPGVDVGSQGGDFFGSNRAKGAIKAGTDVANTLVQQKANLDWNVTQSNQALDEAKAGRTQTAANQGMNYSRLPAQQTMDQVNTAMAQVGGLKELFGIGSAEQTQTQNEIVADIAKFAEDNQLTNPEDMAILMALIERSFSTSSSQGSTTAPGLGYQFVSSAANAAGKSIGS
jgi:hypothetical protein